MYAFTNKLNFSLNGVVCQQIFYEFLCINRKRSLRTVLFISQPILGCLPQKTNFNLPLAIV